MRMSREGVEMRDQDNLREELLSMQRELRNIEDYYHGYDKETKIHELYCMIKDQERRIVSYGKCGM